MSLNCGNLLDNSNYRVIKLLGKGSMGNVYLVERVKDDKKFVVKELIFTKALGIEEKTAREIFFREAGFMGKFEHAGIPKIYGVFSQDGKDYLIMDYIEGKSLEDIISSEKKIPREKAVRWTIELADILDYLHNSFHTPIVYRDLKPSNIIITPDNNATLVDFGIARYYNPDKNTDTFSYGSPGYAAPEQYKGRGQSSPLTDVFGLGVILFQMLTLYDPTLKPFTFPPADELNRTISHELKAIITRAIQLDPLQRFISMQEFKEALGKYINPCKKLQEVNNIKKSPTHPSVIAIYSGLIAVVFFITLFMWPMGLICLTVGFFFSLAGIASYVRDKNISLITATGGLLINVLPVIILAWILIPNFHCAKCSGHIAACESNLKNIATALEMYATDNDGEYPSSLAMLTENITGAGNSYIKKLPLCPHYSSSYEYVFSSDPNSFTLWCGKAGAHRSYPFFTYSIMPADECWPQYTPGEGIKQPKIK